MGDDLNRRSPRVPFQFTLWGLLWLGVLSSVFLAAFRGLGVFGLSIASFALFGAIVGHALGGSIATGRLRCFGAVVGGAIGGVVGDGMWLGPIGLVVGLAVGACWLLLIVGSRPSAVAAESSENGTDRAGERLRETRKTLVEAALIVAAAGLVAAGAFGIIAFATENPLDRWLLVTRVVSLSGGVALLVALTLAGLSLLLGLAARRRSNNGGHENNDDEDL
jgi:MFS family permease